MFKTRELSRRTGKRPTWLRHFAAARRRETAITARPRIVLAARRQGTAQQSVGRVQVDAAVASRLWIRCAREIKSTRRPVADECAEADRREFADDDREDQVPDRVGPDSHRTPSEESPVARHQTARPHGVREKTQSEGTCSGHPRSRADARHDAADRREQAAQRLDPIPCVGDHHMDMRRQRLAVLRDSWTRKLAHGASNSRQRRARDVLARRR